MERLSPHARELLARAQRGEVPTAEFRARVARAWQQKAAALGIGVATTAALAVAAKTASGAVNATVLPGVNATVLPGVNATVLPGVNATVLPGTNGAALGGASTSATAAGSAALSGATATVGTSLAKGALVSLGLTKLAFALGVTAVAGTVSYGAYRGAHESAEPTPPTAHPIPMTPSSSATAREDSSSPIPPETRPEVPEAKPSSEPLLEVRAPVATAPAKKKASSLLSQAKELERANQLLRQGSPAQALELLERTNQERSANVGELDVERLALRISALCLIDNAAKQAEGKTLARAFAAKHPTSPLLQRLLDACEP